MLKFMDAYREKLVNEYGYQILYDELGRGWLVLG